MAADPEFAAPFVVDSSRFTREIATFEPTPHSEAMAATVAWFRAQDRAAV